MEGQQIKFPYIKFPPQVNHIVHVADIHIGKGGDKKSKVFVEVFNKFTESVRTSCNPNDTIIVMVGDIFEYKTYYGGDDIDLFTKLIDGLRGFTVIIIPGNHDADIERPDKMDLISPIVNASRPDTSPDEVDLLSPAINTSTPCTLSDQSDQHSSRFEKVHVFRNTGPILFGNLTLLHISVYDKANSDAIANYIGMSRIREQSLAMLFHGPVNGARIINDIEILGQRITREILLMCDFVMLGDIHQHQSITENAVYCGSLLQHTVRESLVKGYVLWSRRNNIWSHEHIRVYNSTGNVYFNAKTMTIDDIPTMEAPDNIDQVVIYGVPEDEDAAVSNAMIARFGHVDRITKISNSPINIDIGDSQITAMTDALRKNGVSNEHIEEIMLLHGHQTVMHMRRKWYIRRVQWDNLLKYGPVNCVDFTVKHEGVLGVVANNCAGKSSIIDIIVQTLFNKRLRGGLHDMVNKYAKSGKCRLVFESNGEQYVIDRTDEGLKSGKATVKLYKITEGGYEDLSAGEIGDTYKCIQKYVGTYDEFIATALSYGGLGDIVDKTPTDLRKFLISTLGIVNNDNVIEKLNKDIKKIKEQIDSQKKAQDTTGHQAENIARCEEVIDDMRRMLHLDEEHRVKLQIELMWFTSQKIDACKANEELKKLKVEYALLSNQVAKLSTSSSSVQSTQLLETELSELIRQYGHIQQPTDDINVLGSKLSRIETKISDLSREIVNPGICPPGDIDVVRSKIVELYGELRAQPMPVQYDMWKFSESCDCCHNNRQKLHDSERANIVAVNSHNDIIRAKIAEFTLIESSIKKYYDVYREYIQKSQEKEDLMAETAIIRTQILALEAKTKIENLTQKIQHTHTQNDKNIENSERINTLSQRRTEVQINIAAAQKIADAYDKLDKSRIDVIKNELSCAEERISTYQQDIGRLRRDIENYQEDQKILERYNTIVPPLEHEKYIKTQYKSVLSEKAVIIAIIKRSITPVISRVNQILKIVSEFQLKYDAAEDTDKLTIIDAEKEISLCLASGYQKFITSLIFRMVFTTALDSSAEFLMIDEGFGCIDPDNFKLIRGLLETIKEFYRYIFIISHIPGITSMLRPPLQIVANRDRPQQSHILNAPYDVSNIVSIQELQRRILALQTAAQPRDAQQTDQQPVVNQMAKPKRGRKKNSDVNNKTMVECECGISMVQSSLKKHLTSKTHKRQMEKKNAFKDMIGTLKE